jgi:hypothetical protein
LEILRFQPINGAVIMDIAVLAETAGHEEPALIDSL